MVFLFIAYIMFNIFLIVRNFRNTVSYWFSFMLIGFIFAFIGLVFYSEYISNVYYTSTRLFGSVGRYIWMLNYYLDLGVNSQYRMINIGVACYVYGSSCFAVSYAYFSPEARRKFYIILSFFPLVLIILYEPEILTLLYKRGDVMEKINPDIERLINVFNTVFNLLIKIHLIGSIVILVAGIKRQIPLLRKKLKYLIIGVIPIHLLFLVLFYWYPKNIVIFMRLNQLAFFNVNYSRVLYSMVSGFALFSICLLVFAAVKYNIFEINRRKEKIEFQKKMDFASLSIHVFTHSIKNEFVAIKLLAESCSREGERNIPEVGTQISAVCQDSIRKLSSLSKSVSHKRLRYESVDVSSLMREIAARHARNQPRAKIQLSADHPVYLFIDRDQYETVIDNIIENALEAVPCSEYPVIDVGIEKASGFCVITINDNGPGIEEGNLKKVFDPFFSTKPTATNWGFGLTYCQKVIEAFGGYISLENRIPHGLGVTIYLPEARGYTYE